MTSNELYLKCIELGARAIEVTDWSDEKRRDYIYSRTDDASWPTGWLASSQDDDYNDFDDYSDDNWACGTLEL